MKKWIVFLISWYLAVKGFEGVVQLSFLPFLSINATKYQSLLGVAMHLLSSLGGLFFVLCIVRWIKSISFSIPASFSGWKYYLSIALILLAVLLFIIGVVSVYLLKSGSLVLPIKYAIHICGFVGLILLIYIEIQALKEYKKIKS